MTVHTLGMSLRIVFILFAPCQKLPPFWLNQLSVQRIHSQNLSLIFSIMANILWKWKSNKKNLNNSQFCKGSGKNIMMRCDVYMWSMPVLLLFDTVSRFSVCLHCRLASQTCTRPSSFNFWRWFQWQEKNVGIYIYKWVTSIGSCLKLYKFLEWLCMYWMYWVKTDHCYLHAGMILPCCSMIG
jgi:hypothetical protein